MGTDGHSWVHGYGKRQLRSEPGGRIVATMACSKAGCTNTKEVRFKALPGPEVIDRKYTTAGWKLDPARCPEHTRRRKEPPMATKPSPDAIKAQVQMVRLLTDYFDTETGRYLDPWSDKKIAEQTGMSEAAVAEYREAGFGPLKEPAEVEQLRSDIKALEALTTDLEGSLAGIKSELTSMKSKLADISKKFG